MVGQRVAPRLVINELRSLLDSPEIADLIADLEALRWTGRKGYPVRALVGAWLVKHLYAIPEWSRVVRLIAEHPPLREALQAAPSVHACYRFTVKLRTHKPLLDACIDRVGASLREAVPAYGRELAIDATDLPAHANGQRFVSKKGPERKRFSDPDASWGHRSAVSTRKGGGFYGYKLQMAVCTATGLPLAWQVETARHHESKFVAPLLDTIRSRGFGVETCAMDKGYDNNRVYAECEERGCEPIIPLRGAKATQPALPLALGGRLFPRIPRHTKRFRDLYRGRASVERAFGRLKNEAGLAPVRVRGLERVQLHADLCILATLASALARARAIPLAA